MKQPNSDHRSLFMTSLILLAVMMLIPGILSSRPVTKKGASPAPQTFFRQRNTLSNLDFFFTNKGILFNNSTGEGLFYPRGTTNFYIFGGGLWFATKKVLGGTKRKLCELGYNPNSGAGWFTEGEIGSSNGNSAYISYVSPRYDNTTGKYTGGSTVTGVIGSEYWPIWDTSTTKTLNQNYYFGDYISDLTLRSKLAGMKLSNGKVPKPAILSQEEIVNIYSDQNVSANPEFRPNTGYPFGLNVVEVVYSWSFGRYRDMVFVRRKVTNASTDTLYECFMSAAFDPDIGINSGDEQFDDNSFFGLTKADTTFCQKTFPVGSAFQNPGALNMAYQWNTKLLAKIGVVGFTFLESPVTTSNGTLIDISDSNAVGGYCNVQQLGINTYRRWSIANDPPTQDLRYDFQTGGTKDGPLGAGADQRMLFSTGPFTLPPQKSVESTVGIVIAWPSQATLQLNKDSCVKLIAFAHSVFADTSSSVHHSCDSTVVKSFVTPGPPNIPTLRTTCLDRAVLVQWDTAADVTVDPLSSTLAFNTYDLYRTTRSDHDSTIRPDGQNPTVHLGTWSIWNLRQDSLFQTITVGTAQFQKFIGFKYTRTNKTPNQIPHSFLDVGDDNQDGVLEDNEGLYNGVPYYYFLLATNEYDSVNKIGPLTTSIVDGKNFVSGTPCKPVFPDLPNVIAGDSSCQSASIGSSSCGSTLIMPTSGTSVSLEVLDTGKFVQLYANDTVYVSFQPRWQEFASRYVNQSIMNMYVDVTETRQGKNLTYDILSNPNATPSTTPYSFASGIVEQVIGQQCDSNIIGQFTTNNSLFAPYQTIDQAFDIVANHEYRQLNAPYRLHSISFDGGNKGSSGIVSTSARTTRNPQSVAANLNSLDSLTYPSYLGSLGQVTYQITFGNPVQWQEQQYDTTLGVITLNHIKDPNSGADFMPIALPLTITSVTHCGDTLQVIRPGNRNDIAVENDYQYYNKTICQTGNCFPDYSQPDTMIVPLAGKYAMDAFDYSEDSPGDPSTANFIAKTTGMYYFPTGLTPTSAGKGFATIHRLRLGGAEIIFNYPGISNALTAGDSASYSGPFANDFQPGDKITISFSGLMSGLPFPGSKFMIQTSKNKRVDFTSNSLYEESRVLNEVQVVPNPYIVEHIGQSSTDNAKLYFTRLPPRATIEIYNIAGQLVKTLQHNGTATNPDGSEVINSDGSVNLTDRYNVETWNLLSEGLQRVGSQVFVARIIALDPKTGLQIAETTTKFAVVLGGFHIVR